MTSISSNDIFESRGSVLFIVFCVNLCLNQRLQAWEFLLVFLGYIIAVHCRLHQPIKFCSQLGTNDGLASRPRSLPLLKTFVFHQQLTCIKSSPVRWRQASVKSSSIDRLLKQTPIEVIEFATIPTYSSRFQQIEGIDNFSCAEILAKFLRTNQTTQG